MKILPWNRRLLILPKQKEEEPTSILVPEDYKPTRNDHVVARVLAAADDIENQNLVSRTVVVQPNGIEEFVDASGQTHYLVVENYIVCVLEG